MRGDLVLPEEVTSVEQSAFQDTGFVGDLYIGSKMKTIGIKAFSTWNGERLGFYKVTCRAVTPPRCSISSWGTGYAKLLVPYGSIAAYRAIYEWNSFFRNIEGL